MPRLVTLLTLLLACLPGGPAWAVEARIAVAANFTHAAKALGAAFEQTGNHRVTFSFGSTGQLYAQISQGAPFDAFLAADTARPERAEREGLAVPCSRFTYAVGRLVVYGGNKMPVNNETLASLTPARLAVANPATAPYGMAAMEALEALGLTSKYRDRLVRGTSIAQAYQFVRTGNAEVGIVALAQVHDQPPTDYWLIPQKLHSPIAQDAVLLWRGEANEAARAFLAFLQTDTARAIIARMGYLPPGGTSVSTGGMP